MTVQKIREAQICFGFFEGSIICVAYLFVQFIIHWKSCVLKS